MTYISMHLSTSGEAFLATNLNADIPIVSKSYLHVFSSQLSLKQGPGSLSPVALGLPRVAHRISAQRRCRHW